jgi:hypothetical protein
LDEFLKQGISSWNYRQYCLFDAFKISGKQFRRMSEDDWRQWLRRMRAEYRMLLETDERDISPEEDQHPHAAADRLDDAMTALRIIFAEA